MKHPEMRPASVNTVCRLMALLVAFTIGGSVAAAEPERVTMLRARHASLDEALRQNQFKQPLVLESSENANRFGGDIYAVVNYSFSAVQAGLSRPEQWCDIMILHINTKFCHATAGGSSPMLKINFGKKTPEELTDTEQLEFAYSVAATSSEYLGIVLDANRGPMGTSGYRILLEAVPLPGAKTFLHLTFSYDVSFSGKLAMKSYLGTIGSNKVGFSAVGKRSDGQPDYIGGIRGLMERNTMRYYLAIDTYLGATGSDRAAQAEKRLQDWFTATERYPLQLREMDRQTYLTMKRGEYERQQVAQ